jgi:hypothetical protein
MPWNQKVVVLTTSILALLQVGCSSSNEAMQAPAMVEAHKGSTGRELPSGRRNRDQIRAVAKKRTYDENEFKQAAVQLARVYRSDHAHILFFDDARSLEGWGDSGTLRDRDWPHWLYEAIVDDGQVRGSPGKNEKTGKPRDDVFRSKP